MRVALDATAIPADRGGVGRYVDELVPRLVGAGIDLAVLAQVRDVDLFRSAAPRARVVAAPAAVARRPVRLVWEQLGVPRQLQRWRPDVVHSPHYTMPVLTRTPVVVTLHDATFFTHPELHLPAKGRFFRAWTRISAARAAGLFVPSGATRDAVVGCTGADADRFTVARHGVDTTRFHPVGDDERARVRTTLGIGDRAYVAFLGTLEPRKNVPALIRGWIQACAGQADPPVLVLAGGRGWDTGLAAAIAAVPPELTLLRPGYLPLEQLSAFLGGAELVAYPSLGEGFGLPVLEAMASGAAVLTTRRLALPEIGGDAVAYTEPDASAIAAALRRLLDDPARREALRAAGRERAARFSWDACAEAHVAAYERAVNRR